MVESNGWKFDKVNNHDQIDGTVYIIMKKSWNDGWE